MKSISTYSTLRMILLLSLSVLWSCGSDNGDEAPSIENQITIGEIYDLGNAENASDIWIKLVFSNKEVTEYWVLLNKENNAIEVEQIEALNDNQRTTIVDPISGQLHQLNESMLDTDGDPIVNAQDYNIQIYTPANEAVTSSSEDFRLSSRGPLSGSYTGTWNDSFYQNFGISAQISATDNVYNGSFYYTSSFTTCCNGSGNDGTISFTVDGNNVQDFIYNQQIANFTGVGGIMYGDCPGEYTGDGSVSDLLTFSVLFEGVDCEGTHTGGSIVFRRSD